MRYLTYLGPDSPREPRWGARLGEAVVDLAAAQSWAQGARGLPPEPLPDSLFGLIHAGPQAWAYARNLINALEGEDPLKLRGAHRRAVAQPLSAVRLFPPLPRPMSIRDFYAFEQHVKTANANRGREVPAEWYEFPVFYFTNPNAIFGVDEAVIRPRFTQALDYELEVACVIGQVGRDIHAEDAEKHIFGYTIMNDWSARDVQRQEMKVGLGPAKGKDFATSLGPWIVTPDELAEKRIDWGARGSVYDLEMSARVNGVERSRGNWKDIHYTFGQMIERASADVFLLPGDVIGSGTVGTGCLLELTKAQGPWLKPGDVVELEIERLGILRNRVGSQ